MDALDRILPLASLLWPLADCDASIRRDPSSACASTGAAYLARVFDCDHPDGMDARPLAEAAGDTPAASAEALAAHLAALARPRFDALRRVMGVTSPDVERLTRAVDRAADERNAAVERAGLLADRVARLERSVADLTRERDGLRVRLDGQAAHGAAGEGVDRFAAAVRHEAHCMEWIASVTESHAIRDALSDRAQRLRDVLARFGHLRGEAVEGSEHQAVEGGEGHEATIGRPAAEGKAHVG